MKRKEGMIDAHLRADMNDECSAGVWDNTELFGGQSVRLGTPDISLSRSEADDIAGYIATLKN